MLSSTQSSALAARTAWDQILLAALLMVATLPGRTQGLGLITEPMLDDLQIDRLDFARVNLWATLLGSLICLPAGGLFDRWGLRGPSTVIVVLLAAVVWQMSRQSTGGAAFFVWVLLTRALGQGALSVASITKAGKAAGPRPGIAMGVYAVLLSLFFAAGFVVVGGQVLNLGWRMAWQQVSVALVLVVAPMAAYFTRTDKKSATVTENAVGTGYTLAQALRMPGFWVFGGAIALFGLVSAGLGLFNEAVLGERGFDARTFHVFLAVTTLFALAGQFLCGWLNQHCSLARMTGIALILYGAGLATLPLLTTRPQLWVFAGIFGVAGGMITVVFFSVWGQAFGMAHLGQIQGAAQMLTVFASALGPLLFAHCHARTGSYTPLLLALAPVVLVFAGACWRVRLSPPPPATHRNSIR